MASALEASLSAELASWESAGRRRQLADDAGGGADFRSNDYLGLATHPRVIAAARRALEQHGAGAGAARLLGGGTPLHAAAERAVADWLGAETALLFPTGYQANLGLVGAVAGPGDLLFSDERNHASLVDAARLSRARVVVYRHLDLDELARGLALARGARRRIVATESVFSMDGDLAPLAELAALCARQDAWLVVDEAHALGLLGPEGRGAWPKDLAPERLLARVVTGGKALGAAGGLVAGGRVLCEQLVNRARAFVYTTAPPPAVAGALVEAVALARAADAERARALAHARRLAAKLGLAAPAAAIVPLVLGADEHALAAAARLASTGLDVRAVRPPTVPEGSARLRIVCHAFNTDAEVTRLARGLAGLPRPTALRARATLARTVVVAGTDTGVGKTVVSAALLRAAAQRGAAAYWKPVQTGSDDDTAEVARLAGAPTRFAPRYAFRKPAAPHEAAAAEGASVDVAELARTLAAHRATLGDGVLVVELAGGLLVPYTADCTQADWLARERPAIVLVARSGLGTLNHTLLTLEALRARHLEPAALFLCGEPHAENRATLARLAGVPALFELPCCTPLDADALAAWLERHDLGAVLGP